MPSRHKPDLLDPVVAYDRIAPEYVRISNLRQAYLKRVEQLIVSAIPPGPISMLDIGSGDGIRAFRIASAARVDQLTLLEPSAAMRSQIPSNIPSTIRVWPIKAEELHRETASFDVITCLWNVLGHIFPMHNRTEVLRQCSRLLSPRGTLFIDVNNRYNARIYGLIPTTIRALYDRFLPGERNGDVIAKWTFDGNPCHTPGHVFTPAEFIHLARSANLTIERRFIVDYATGQLHKSPLQGNLLYFLRPARTFTA